MADGTYERRGPREAELKRLQRLIDEQRSKATLAAETTGTLWEFDRPEASCNHGFASYLAILLDEDE